MNDDRSLERRIAVSYDASAPSREPAGLLDDVLLTTGRSRQRPRWLALIKEPPMRLTSGLAVGSPTARVAALLVVTLLLVIMATGAVVAGSAFLAGPAPIVVALDGTGAHATITDAVAVAEDGDTILVRPGTYSEAVTITKDVALVGDGPRDQIVLENPPDGPVADHEIIREFSAGPLPPFALLVEGADATISGLTVSGPMTGGIAVIVIGGAPRFEDVSIVTEGPPGTWEYYAAVYILGGSRAHVARSALHGYVSISGSSPTIEGTHVANQVNIEGSPETILRGDSFSASPRDGYSGVVFGAGSTGIFEDNDLSAGVLEISGGGDVQVRDNAVGGQGIRIVDEGTVTSITGNTVSSTLTGIDVGAGAEATIEGNTIMGGSAGLIFGSGAVRAAGNTITGARNGIIVTGDAAPTITGNSFCDNEQDLVVPEGSTLVLDPSNEVCPA